MKKLLLTLISLNGFFLSYNDIETSPSPLLLGSVQFPVQSRYEPVPVYYGGHIISVEMQRSGKMSFEIPKEKYQTTFYVLVAPAEYIRPHVVTFDHDGDVLSMVDYLFLKTSVYKLYELALIEQEKSADFFADGSEENTQEQQVAYQWNIQEMLLPENGHIPDNTVIISFIPELVYDIRGGSELALPTIYVKNSDKIEDSTQAQDLVDVAVQMQLAALDINTLHAPTKKIIANATKCTFIIAPAH